MRIFQYTIIAPIYKAIVSKHGIFIVKNVFSYSVSSNYKCPKGSTLQIYGIK